MEHEPKDGYYRIKLHAIPATDKADGLPEAYYGPVDGNGTTNRPIYCRVAKFEDAYKLRKHNAMQVVTSFRSKGYECHCEPPIVVVY